MTPPGTSNRRKAVPRSCLTLYVRDLQATVDFYSCFSPDVGDAIRMGRGWAKLDMRESAMSVCWMQDDGSPHHAARRASRTMGFKLSIGADYIHSAVCYAVAAGAVLIEAYQTRTKRAAVVRDPDGLLVEIYDVRNLGPEEEASDIERNLGLG